MLNFEPINLGHIPMINEYFRKKSSRTCDRTVGGTFMWRDYFDTQFCIEDNTLFLKVIYLNGDMAFIVPLGEEPEKGVLKLLKYCNENSISLVFCTVTEEDLEFLKRVFSDLEIVENRDWFDYLYSSNDMVNFGGRKFSGPRNHINKFLRMYSNWSFEEITHENLENVKEFFQKFIDVYKKDSDMAYEEAVKVFEVIDKFDAYGMHGGILKVDDKIIGMSVGEVINDTLYVHIEKADREYDGAYQMLVNQFAKAFVTEDVLYINREEDVGDEGLRKSKLSYRPIKLLEKYTVTVK